MDIVATIVPRLSKDIEVSSFDSKSYLIKHKLLNYQVKVNHPTMEMLNLVNGNRSITDIAKLLSDRFGTELDPPTVYDKLFSGKLADCGIIETDKEIEPKKSDGYIWFKFTILKAHQITWLAKVLSYLFSPIIFYTLFFVSLSYLISVLLVFGDANTIFDRIVQPENLLFFYGISLVSMFFHEMGHASACKKFGAQHGDIGFGFYLLMPVFYADVSDAWRLSRHQRFIIDMAGVYMELLFYIGISLFFFSSRDPFILELIFLRMIGSAFNLNPFLRFDGYWALSDLINVPNLRKNSDVKLKNAFRWMFGKTSRPLSRPMDYFLVGYSAISWSFTVLFLMAVLYFNPGSVIYFPIRFYEFLANTAAGLTRFNGELIRYFLTNFGLPITFYFMLGRWLYTQIKYNVLPKLT